MKVLNRHLTKESIKVINQHMKRCSASLEIGELQSKNLSEMSLYTHKISWKEWYCQVQVKIWNSHVLLRECYSVPTMLLRDIFTQKNSIEQRKWTNYHYIEKCEWLSHTQQWVKKVRHRGLYTVWFHLYIVQK